MTTDTIIDVRNTRAYVSRKQGTDTSFHYEPCANWEWLEDAASEAVARLGGSVTLSALYPCPPDLARFALWREDVLGLVTTAPEAAARFHKEVSTVQKALKSGRVPHRQSGATYLLLWQDAGDEWGGR